MFHSAYDSHFELDIKMNWKLAVENYCESYHLPGVHPPGLNSYSKLSDHCHIEELGYYSGQGTLVNSPMIDPSVARFKDFAGRSEKWERAGESIALFPNVLLGVYRDQAFAILLVPVAVDRTVKHISMYYANEEMCEPIWSELRAKRSIMWKEVFVRMFSWPKGCRREGMGRHSMVASSHPPQIVPRMSSIIRLQTSFTMAPEFSSKEQLEQ